MEKEYPGETDRAYIGDGVYVSFDGYHVWLRTEAGDGRTYEIALDPAVLAAFDRWRAGLKAAS